MKNENKIFIGLIKVKPIGVNSIIGRSEAAYVNVIAIAESAEEYLKIIKLKLLEFQLKVISYEDVESVAKRLDNFEISEDLKTMLNEISESEPIKFGEFHCY